MDKKKKTEVPDFVCNVACYVPEGGYDALSNWLKLHAYIDKFKADRKGIDALRWLIAKEAVRVGGPRMDIVKRLYKRFSRLRRENELAQIDRMK